MASAINAWVNFFNMGSIQGLLAAHRGGLIVKSRYGALGAPCWRKMTDTT